MAKNEDLAVRLITMVFINLANTQNNTIMMHLVPVVVHLNDDSIVKLLFTQYDCDCDLISQQMGCMGFKISVHTVRLQQQN